jgi:ring-1,2-phenylacetyl-CoA epoxidase subunit PaaD
VVTEAQLWARLAEVYDPELPTVSLVDLGIIRRIIISAESVTVLITPTYSGCPAHEVIAQDVRQAVIELTGYQQVVVQNQLAPAWTSDWITPLGRSRLQAAGIVPPNAAVAHSTDLSQPIHFNPHIRCPQCSANAVEQLAAFGATACKAIYRCLVCREPFDVFKAI